jgi:hypothetical protein
VAIACEAVRRRGLAGPQGLFVSDLGMLSGNPMIYVGFTNRICTGDSFVRQHVIKRLRDPATVLTPDWTSPAMV